jgi:gliding motility-associated-like protein
MQQILFYLSIFLFSVFGFSQGPTAQFTATPLVICEGESITFTNTSTIGNSPIVKWSWDFGDGYSSDITNPSHTYDTPGTYTVILVVTDQNQIADDETKIGYITVGEIPTAQFNVTGNLCTIPAMATFINQSTNGTDYKYDWDFGNTQTSNLENPSEITYATSSNFVISLNVTNTKTGCHSGTSSTITTSNFITDFEVQQTACIETDIPLIDKSSTGADDWLWSDGAGNIYSTQNPTIKYLTSGTYNLSLTSKNNNSGCQSTVTKTITIFPENKPTFSITPASGCIPLVVNFTNLSTNNSNYEWDFGDGSPLFSGSNPPAHSYLSNGQFSVSLSAKDINGCISKTISQNIIQTGPPIANFESTVVKGCAPLSVQLTDLSTSKNPTEDPINSWEWDFGNGFTSNLPNPPSQIYTANPGIYTITLKIKTLKGCEATETKQNYIQVGAIDLVNFSNTPTTSCAKSDVQFTNLSVVSVPYNPSELIYNWDFGDAGTPSSEKDPIYTYPIDTGYFDVTLTLTLRGCVKDFTVTKAVFIKAPISLFKPSETSFCNPDDFPTTPVKLEVSDLAKIGRKGDAIVMIWRWDDPLKSNTTLSTNSFDSNFKGSSSFEYTEYGNYTVKQVIYNNTTGCKDSSTQQFTISKIDAGFTLSANTLCKNSQLIMTGNATTVPIGLPVTYSYDMGITNGVSSGNPATFNYSESGLFDIVLTAQNSFGCKSIQTIPFTSLELPLAVISTPSTACTSTDLIFSNASVKQGNGYPTLSSFLWTLPDGSSQTTTQLNEQTHFISASPPGNYNYTVKLVATDGFGCISLPATKNINVTRPTPDFIYDPLVCNLETFNIADNSVGLSPFSYKWKIDNILKGNSKNFSYFFKDPTNTNKIQHNITLSVTDANGCNSSISKLIDVSIPHADFTYGFSGANLSTISTASCPPVFATFTNQSTVLGTTFSSLWDFGDGKSSFLKDAKNTYVFADTYTSKLKITDQYNCVDDTILVDYLRIDGPRVKVNTYPTGTICDNLYFFDTLNPQYVDRLIWDFGDGSTSTISSVEHDYPTGGTYSPILTIYDTQNCGIPYKMNSFSVSTELKAFFTTNPSTANTGTEIIFDDQSSYNVPILSWLWEYKDFDNTSLFNNSDANTSFTYDLPYLYPASLTITDQNGCESKYVSPIRIKGDFIVPNVFTPNNDGVNDNFKFYYNLFKSYDVTILNRWDNVVYERKNVTGVYIWDGTNKDKEQCSEGVYFYVIKGTLVDETPFEKIGSVTKLD